MGVFELTLVVAALILGVVITGVVRFYALRTNLVDIPNDRSSHSTATPRGGGLSIVLVFAGVLVSVYMASMLSSTVFIVLLAATVAIAAVGFLDDHVDIAPIWRFLVQASVAAGVVIALGGMPPVDFGRAQVDLGVTGDILLVVFMVWFTNAFNFMDGIDGIAGVETTFIATSAVLLIGVSEGGAVNVLLAALAASTTGFLAWNWPPAKIFMGDVGSAFAGFILVAIALVASGQGIMPLWPWLILSSVFVVDATVTLVTRMLRGDEWHSAHRSHAYQKAARRFGSHRSVTLLVLAINVVWLLPLAFVAARKPETGWWLTCLAWTPLVIVSLLLGSGRPDKSDSAVS